MSTKTFTTNTQQDFGVEASSAGGRRFLSYTGSLGGGTLRVLTRAVAGGPLVPVPDSKLSAAKVDDNGDVVQQMWFVAAGMVVVELSGATAPNCLVSVL